MSVSFVVGIDEAGRGPVAGPVAVAAFCVPKKAKHRLLEFFKNGKIRDSKKLTEESRRCIFKELAVQKKRGDVLYAVSFASSTVIDRQGISFAIRHALAECLKALGVTSEKCEVLLDGALKAPKKFKRQRTIIKGDETEAVIALASIVAKVSRDRKMVAFAKKYPGYGFEIHKGYGTKKHYQALRRQGLSSIHRRSFLKNVMKPGKFF